MCKAFLGAVIVQMMASSLSASWHDRKAEGWAWYEDRQVEEKQSEVNEPKSNAQILSEIRVDLEEKLAKATLKPTKENVEAYIKAQKVVLDRSMHFANVWQRVILLNPDLDSTRKVPVSQYGSQLYKSELRKKKEGLIRSLSSEYGLFFFYDSSCPYSVAFSEVIKAFSSQYDWEVVAISVDGGSLKEFPEYQLDNGISSSFGVQGVPALFAINPKEEKVAPIAYGLVAVDKIEDNIFLQFGHDLLGGDDAK